jgi:hypothetical protein
MTWVIFGVFSLVFALWDLAMIAFGIIGLKSVSSYDSSLFRGLTILGFSLITLGVSADLGIAAGSLGIVISVIWFILAFLPLGGDSKSEEKGDQADS